MTCSEQTLDPEVTLPEPTERARSPITTALALTTGTAVLVSAEFVPAGVLPLLAESLGVTEGRAGLAVAATALAGAITAPTIASVVPRMDRRKLLIILIAIAALSNLVVALAPNLPVLLIGRVVLGVAIAGYWSFTFGVGVSITNRPALISTALALGTSLATIIGVPLASIAGDAIGWRNVFFILIGLTVLSGVALARVLPPVPAHPSAGLAMMRQVLSNKRLIAGIITIGLVAFGNFTAYPYIRVAIEAIAPHLVGVLLLAWGIGGLIGNLLGGWFSTRLRIGVALAPAILAIALATISTQPQNVLLAAAVVAWGLGFNMVPVTTQLWVSRVEPARLDAAVSLQVMAFQVAITLGAIVGGLIVDHATVWATMTVGAVAAALAAVSFASMRVVQRED